ncbi:SulP family sulfate transporter [Pseudolabrys sp. Root1462]|uniref:SulP family inorganic anion transporter n=1 Tax=Pseudolabrys sp. Root1462 TaxID=1736466 RepID=UPI0007028683|nr:SulP family inorganic anion transporter [Pseudolabrys sp. Root1462]KQY98054.1 SulP family sulfate transporter [Pseudolabrys sp. Root1462]
MSSQPPVFAPPTFVELFTPKLVTVFREGYGWRDLRADAIAGLTVAVVALPLSMAIAIASGVSPERGLYTAIAGGFIVSLIGGSRFQIGGPAGAFIGLVASVVERHGYDGLALATIVAGLILIVVALLRLGTYIKYIPLPVTVGFTAGIAVIIAASQVREVLGLDIAHEPSALVPKVEAIAAALSTISWQTLGIAALSLAIILVLRRYRPRWPGFLIAIAVAGAICFAFHLDVATVASRFGAVPRSLPAPSLPPFSLEKLQAVLPDAFTIALLCAIESLLSAVVADGMSGRRHRSNAELGAQGIASITSVIFGGICVTGTVARTATNVRSGARGPISGIFHCGYLLLFLAVAAPLVGYIPLAALGAVLIIVSWNMAEKEEFWSLVRTSRGDAAVLLATFLLTIFVDLTTGIAVGVVMGALMFLHRMAESVDVQAGGLEDVADSVDQAKYDAEQASSRDVMVYRITGAFFFGATAQVLMTLERIGRPAKLLILDFSDVPLIDTTAARSLHAFAKKLDRAGTKVSIAAAKQNVRHELTASGLKPPLVTYAASVAAARAAH